MLYYTDHKTLIGCAFTGIHFEAAGNKLEGEAGFEQLFSKQKGGKITCVLASCSSSAFCMWPAIFWSSEIFLCLLMHAYAYMPGSHH